MRRLLMNRALALTLAAGAVLPATTIRCDPYLGGGYGAGYGDGAVIVNPGYYAPVYSDAVVVDDCCCCGGGWGFDWGWSDWWF